MAAVEAVYTSCGCNRGPHSVDWGRNGLVCYGSCNAVVVFTPKAPSKVICTLVGHTDRVNSVQWIRNQNSEPETEILSCSTDKTARLWKRDADGKFTCRCVLSGHTSTVTQGRAVHLDAAGTHTLIATASVDSTLRIWERTADKVECLQTIPFGTGFVLDISWIVLPDTKVPLLACGGDDQKVYLMVQQGNEFHPVLKLVGHEDWIRCLDMTVDDSGDVLVASSSQDHFIRIWRLSPRDPETVGNKDDKVLDTSPDVDLKMKENTFTFKNKDSVACYAVTLESVLQGHEHWVYGVHWHPATLTAAGCRTQPLCLLSVSMDKTMILWAVDADSGVWVDQVRVGSVGGNTLGLYGGVFSPDGETILAHGYQGAFHMWSKQSSTAWSPGVTMGGHFGPVQDIAWDPVDGHFLLSNSADQTTRLHGYWNADQPEESAWHEVARPQVHGYDMTCLSMLDRYTFVSGADEKVIRVFQAPRNFVTNFSRVCKVDLSGDLKDTASSLPEGASVPALGLSNKAVFDSSSTQSFYEGDALKTQNDLYQEAYFSPLTLSEPPTEENLLQNTLWPEVQKLYGHGYEIFALACHPDGSLLASACKAAKAEHAAVLLWDRSTWHQVGRLEGHGLTVTQLSFCHTGRYLLSVSRDRTWVLHQRRAHNQPDTDPLYSRVASADKKTSGHARIIWGCAWSHDDKYFITVSRDKKAIIWGWSEKAEADGCLGAIRQVSAPLTLPDSVTAVDMAPTFVKENNYLVAFGLDAGAVLLYRWSDTPAGAATWAQCAVLQQQDAHHLTIRRVRFCPKLGAPGSTDSSQHLMLASCGADHAVRIHSIDLSTL